MARSKQRFNKRSPAKRALLAVIFAVSLGLVTAAERDLQQRPAEQVRGPKALWRVVCLNALGAVSYFHWGRRSAVDISHT